MGIGLVDPILKPIADQLDATPSQVSLLFTSYMAVTGIAMLVTGWVSSRIGAKRTLLTGLVLIIVFAALAGSSDSIGAIVGFRAGWGLGNALFIATALATIVDRGQRLGRAGDHPVRGGPGPRHRRRPAGGRPARLDLVARPVLRGGRADGDRAGRDRVLPAEDATERAHTSLADPFKALRYPGLLTIAVTALFYNMGFFALLAYAPFPLDMTASQVGFIFFGWGLLLAFTSVWVAPWLQRLFGTVPTVLASLLLFAADLVMMAVLTDSKTALVVGIIVAGAFLGINNTLITEAVMGAAPVERPVASSAYSFVRFSGGAIAPYAAGRLGENVSIHAPFWMGAGAVLIGVVVLFVGRNTLQGHLHIAGSRRTTPTPRRRPSCSRSASSTDAAPVSGCGRRSSSRPCRAPPAASGPTAATARRAASRQQRRTARR